jgi:methylmalonyl-CoA mutase N-terminal domain/subunit
MTKKIREEKERWEKKTLNPHLKHSPERQKSFTTVSGKPIRVLYTPDDVSDLDYFAELGFPGEYPYTRGVQPSMYRGRLWTMRQFSGFGTPEDTNQRYKYLLKAGQTGLSVAFHLPTLMGIDSDHPLAEGEVGKCGVAIDSLKDMEILFDGIPLDRITTSMTINAPAAILLAMYIVVAEKQGVDIKKISGTIQNDILKEYIAQKTWIYPPKPSMRLITDVLGFCRSEVPRWNTISISGYHIREAGSTAVQELAFTLRDGVEYVEWGIRAGLDVDDFAPRLSFFFNAHNDLFEEVAKYRAARRIWARVMKERFHVKHERSLLLRFHTQTAGCSLTAQQPYNNVVRVTIQALAGILGGTQSLHTNSLDETLALPGQHAVTIALRTQQILAHESGVANTIDPLGGSYFVEALTRELEEGTWDYFKKIDDMGGMVAAIEAGFPQREIMDASYEYQKAIEKKEKIIVGVNEYQSEESQKIELLKIDLAAELHQKKKLADLKRARDPKAVRDHLEELTRAAGTGENLLPCILRAVKSYATLGEIVDAMKKVFGEYQEPATF